MTKHADWCNGRRVYACRVCRARWCWCSGSGDRLDIAFDGICDRCWVLVTDEEAAFLEHRMATAGWVRDSHLAAIVAAVRARAAVALTGAA